jgi:hypothetical protein
MSASDAVIGTFAHPRYALVATGAVHDGEAAGRAFRCRMTAFCVIAGAKLVCERVSSDAATILRQLTQDGGAGGTP